MMVRTEAMDVQHDLDIWQERSNSVGIADLLYAYDNPCPFQTELEDYISDLFCNDESPSSLEVGSSFGITSALLPQKFKKSILDFDSVALTKGVMLFEKIGQAVDTVNLDILLADADSLHDRYDVVFSAGLLEHFDERERRAIIETMVRYTKAGGYLVIGIPNHYWLPYRIIYLLLVILKRWEYPREYKIRNFNAEIGDLDGITPIAETCLDRGGVYSLYPRHFANIARHVGKICSSEGYLKVFLFQRRGMIS